MLPWSPGRSLVAFGVALLAVGCGADDKQCDLSAAYGLTVYVTDAMDTPICDVTVRIEDGDHVEESPLDIGMCVFHGALERPGTYDVSALRDDEVLVATKVGVPAGECHVQGQQVTLVVPD